MTLFGTLIFKPLMESRSRSGFLTCIYDGRPYGSRHRYHLLATVARNSTLGVWKGPRSLSDIFYILKKQKNMVPFIHSSYYTIAVKKKDINCTFPVNVPSPEENVTSQGFPIF